MTIKLGIIGAGWIADKMAETITGLKNPEVQLYAISSRNLEKAEFFAKTWNVPNAYGSYEEMLQDPEVNLVYVATPHSHHFAHSKMCIEAGKPVLCEKAFTANAREARELIELAHSKKIFITEAIWTRYMPLSRKVMELIKNGEIGRPRMIYASLCYAMENKERILRPDLCGGALLDLGVYCLNFARMFFGTDIVKTDSSCVLGETGMDMYETITFQYADGKMASLVSSAYANCNREGLIVGDDGYIVIDNTNCPASARLFTKDYKLREVFFPPDNQVTGYEHQVLACKDALEKGLLESPYMPHAETIAIMEEMDALRAEWGVKYPMD
jgi:predicted dehydrogenase